MKLRRPCARSNMTADSRRYLFVYGTLMSGAQRALGPSSGCVSPPSATASARRRCTHAGSTISAAIPAPPSPTAMDDIVHGEVVLLADPRRLAHLARRLRGLRARRAATATNTTASCARCASPAARRSMRGSISCAARRTHAPHRQRPLDRAAEPSASRISRDVESWPATPNGPLPRRHGPRLRPRRPAPIAASYTRHGAATIGASKNIYSCAYRAEVTCEKFVAQIDQLTPQRRPTRRRARLRTLLRQSSQASSASLKRLANWPRSMAALCAACWILA